MKLNRLDLKKIMYEFNTLANRLLQADFQDYDGVLSKFIRFIAGTEIINDFISDCGECDQDLEQEFKEVQTGHAIFSLGDTDKEEVCNTYAILRYAAEHNIKVAQTIAMSYSYSRKYQEILKDFNDRVTMVLIRHIETYLTKVGIDMGLDDNIVYSITIKNGQVIIANDNATINASNNVNQIDIGSLEEIIEIIKKEAAASDLSSENIDILNSSLEVVREEAKANKPRKHFIKTALAGINAIKGTTEFGAAVATLMQFIQPLIG